MNKNKSVYHLHNSELTKDVITSAVSAFCERKTDSCMMIEICFEKLLNAPSDMDTCSKAEINILKPEDYKSPKRPNMKWVDIDQKLIESMRRVAPVKEKPLPTYWNRIGNVLSFLSFKPASSTTTAKAISPLTTSKEKQPKGKGTAENKIPFKRNKARLWELPSGEFYAVKYHEPKRRINLRRSSTDLKTAQEVLAVREQGDANDRTDKDCPTTLCSTGASSVESVLDPVRKMPSPPKRTPSKRPKEKSPGAKPKAISIRRVADTGELLILEEKNGVVKFSCFTKQLEPKSSRSNR